MKKYIIIILSVFIVQMGKSQTDSLYFGLTPPTDTPVRFGTGKVTGYVHGRMAISPLGNEIYWTINPGLAASYGRIMYSKYSNGSWSTPAVANFGNDYLTTSNIDPAFSPDGSKIFYSSTRPGGLGKSGVWFVEKTESGWNGPFNVVDSLVSSPIFTNTEKAYFWGFNNKWESLAFCYKYTAGIFSDPVTIENIPEYGPWYNLFVSPEEDYLIFASGDPNCDLFIRFKNPDGQWGTPINMGSKINTTSLWERFPYVSPDGKYLFFTRGNGSVANLYWVSTAIIDSLRNNATTGINQLEEQKIEIYPNPTNGQFTISFGTTPYNEATAEIYNTEGKLVFSKTFQKKITLNFDLTGFRAGLYVAKVIADGFSYEEKIIKK